MTFDTNIKISDLMIGGTALFAAMKIILSNRDILKNLIRVTGEHEKKIADLKLTVEEHDDIIIRNGLDLRADRNLTRRRKYDPPDADGSDVN